MSFVVITPVTITAGVFAAAAAGSDVSVPWQDAASDAQRQILQRISPGAYSLGFRLAASPFMGAAFASDSNEEGVLLAGVGVGLLFNSDAAVSLEHQQTGWLRPPSEGDEVQWKLKYTAVGVQVPLIGSYDLGFLLLAFYLGQTTTITRRQSGQPGGPSHSISTVSTLGLGFDAVARLPITRGLFWDVRIRTVVGDNHARHLGIVAGLTLQRRF